ncbi:MAG TPA: glycosyltransferase [Thermoplasmata archaeon]|jgi:glycosyltransferase involved in cell wall biosynthesis|nr:glycosyltransferase [Thermoplasmata archaeon]
MRVGLYSDHLNTDGNIGTGYSKYIYYLTRELRNLDVEVVPLHKGANPTDVDVLHDPASPWDAPLWTRRPLVITIHDLFPALLPRYYGLWIRNLYIQKLRWFSFFCKRILVDSERTKEVVQSVLRPRAPMDVVHLGLEEKFRPMAVDPPATPFILQVGIHREIKEPKMTFRAFESIANQIPHELHFVGDVRVPWFESLGAYLARHPDLRSRVKVYWPGEAGLPEVYNGAELVVHPTPEEGFGFIPLEALGCGAHVLARAPAVREVLGPMGCYFTDSDELATAMLDCLRHPPKSTRDQRVARARLFTFRKMAERTVRAYELAMAG